MLRLMAYSASRPHDEDFLMQAHEFMTKEPVTVSPDTPTPEIARLLLAHKISAAPVVDDAGTPIGMVSEGDLLGRGDADREARRDWWLMLLAEGEALHPDFPDPNSLFAASVSTRCARRDRPEAGRRPRYRKFESISLQRRVVCEPDFLAATVADVEQRQALPT
jgi:hypothetical protein